MTRLSGCETTRPNYVREGSARPSDSYVGEFMPDLGTPVVFAAPRSHPIKALPSSSGLGLRGDLFSYRLSCAIIISKAVNSTRSRFPFFFMEGGG